LITGHVLIFIKKKWFLFSAKNIAASTITLIHLIYIYIYPDVQKNVRPEQHFKFQLDNNTDDKRMDDACVKCTNILRFWNVLSVLKQDSGFRPYHELCLFHCARHTYNITHTTKREASVRVSYTRVPRFTYAYPRRPSERLFLLKRHFFNVFFVLSIAQYRSWLAFSNKRKRNSTVCAIISKHLCKHDDVAAGSGTEDHQIPDVRFQSVLHGEYISNDQCIVVSRSFWNDEVAYIACFDLLYRLH